MLHALLEKLSERKSSETVFNQYRDAAVRNNLRLYFEYLLNDHHAVLDVLMVGEAPGYGGCRLTGIPFTSGAVVRSSHHAIFKKIGSQIRLPQIVKEPTATIVWEFLGEDRPLPILWNTFPFHPHTSARPKSNRGLSSTEIAEGRDYLKMVYELVKPRRLCAIGRRGEEALKQCFPGQEITFVRHPANGGKREFFEGMKRHFYS